MSKKSYPRELLRAMYEDMWRVRKFGQKATGASNHGTFHESLNMAAARSIRKKMEPCDCVGFVRKKVNSIWSWKSKLYKGSTP